MLCIMYVYMCVVRTVTLYYIVSLYTCVVSILVGYQSIFAATEDPYELRLMENSR